jgi:hypothetical protein
VTQLVPHSREAVVDRSGLATRPWYAWFQRIEDAANAGAISGAAAAEAIRAIAIALGSPDGSVGGIPPLPGAALYVGNQSVTVQGGDGLYTFALQNDQFEPLPTSFYGSDRDGVRGWRTLREADGVVIADGEAGVDVYALDPLAVYFVDEDGAIMVDETGAPIVAETPSTSQLPEGSNLYFTTERAQDAVGAAIAAGTGDGASLSYNDAAGSISVTNTDKGSTAVAALVAAPDPFPQYLTQPEGDARYAAIGAPGTTNLSTTRDATTVTVASDTGTDAVLVAADASNAGVMTAAQSSKLAGIATGATANLTNAQLLDRANHTGTQLAATVSDFAAAVRAAILTGLSTATAAAITAADSVLSALGKLQAQITANTASIATKEPAIAAGTTGQFVRGDKSVSNVLSGPLVLGAAGAPLPFAPAQLIEFQDSEALSSSVMVRYAGNSNGAFFLGYKGRGTRASPAAVQAGDLLFALRGSGFTSATTLAGTQAAEIAMYAVDNFTAGAQGTRIQFSTTPSGTAAPALRGEFTDAGAFRPGADNAQAIGSTSLRWSDIYAARVRPGDGTCFWTTGTGSPEGVVVAPVGSLYTRTDGGAGTTLYVKQSGSGNTGWAAK